jgi:citrate synthase
MDEGDKASFEGRLFYRGIEVNDFVRVAKRRRHGFIEVCYLLLFGRLPAYC